MGLRSFVRDRKQVKADRATEQGIAGHQAASKALGNAVERTGNTPKLQESMLIQHENDGARAHSKYKTRESFAGRQPSHVEVRPSGKS